jgi:hypothetical protein
MRRRWKLVLLGIGSTLAILAAWLVLRPAPPSAKINAAAYERIEEGMTAEEVAAVIGLPPGDYRQDSASPRRRAELLAGPNTQILEWEADNCNIQVRVDRQSGRVKSKIFGEDIPSAPRSWLVDLRNHFNW